jgi:RNase H-fold protein (predicted Holliday junction resolvase)
MMNVDFTQTICNHSSGFDSALAACYSANIVCDDDPACGDEAWSDRSLAFDSGLYHEPRTFPGWNVATLVPQGQGPFLAVDWGKKRAGLAMSDPERRVAVPLEVCSAGPVLRHKLVEYWQHYGASAVIFGWPVDRYGRPSALTPAIERLTKRLHQDHGWPIAFADETLSSWAVESNQMQSEFCALSAKSGRPGRRFCGPGQSFQSSPSRRHATGFSEARDSYAAASFLQGFLDQWHQRSCRGV